MTVATSELLRQVRYGSKEEKISAIRQLSGDLSRDVLIALGEIASGEGIVAAEAEKVLKKSIVIYAERHFKSYFHVVPWGTKAVSPESFREIYEKTSQATAGFRISTEDDIFKVLLVFPQSILIFRTILGFSSAELSYVSGQLGTDVNKITIDRIEKGRLPHLSDEVLKSLARAIYQIIAGKVLGLPSEVNPRNFKSRMDKFDTISHWEGVRKAFLEGVPYWQVLYERYTGGNPFGYLINANSELKGDLLEDPIEALLKRERIPYHRSKPGDKIQGIIQAPDFYIPQENDPQVVIESKVAEDGGTVRDKASRFERLRKNLSEETVLIAVLDGKGFLQRINDGLLPIFKACRGHVYSYDNLEEILEIPAVAYFIGRANSG